MGFAISWRMYSTTMVWHLPMSFRLFVFIEFESFSWLGLWGFKNARYDESNLGLHTVWHEKSLILHKKNRTISRTAYIPNIFLWPLRARIGHKKMGITVEVSSLSSKRVPAFPHDLTFTLQFSNMFMPHVYQFLSFSWCKYTTYRNTMNIRH